MNSKLESKLLEAARKTAPDDRVPYAFEKRIMAKLASLPPAPLWAQWGKPLWRAAISCLAVTLVCGFWSIASIDTIETDVFPQDFEVAVYSTMNQHMEDAW